MLEVEKVGLAYFIRGGVMALSWNEMPRPFHPSVTRVLLVGVRLINLPSSSRERADRQTDPCEGRTRRKTAIAELESLVHSLFLSALFPSLAFPPINRPEPRDTRNPRVLSASMPFPFSPRIEMDKCGREGRVLWPPRVVESTHNGRGVDRDATGSEHKSCIRIFEKWSSSPLSTNKLQKLLLGSLDPLVLRSRCVNFGRQFFFSFFYYS